MSKSKKITITKDDLFELSKKYGISDDDMARLLVEPTPKEELGPTASVQTKDDPLFIRYLYTFISDEQAALPHDLLTKTIFEEIDDFEKLKSSNDARYEFSSQSFDSSAYLYNGHWIPNECSVYSFLREFSYAIFDGMSDAAIDTYKTVHPEEYANELKKCLGCLEISNSRRTQRTWTPYMAHSKNVCLKDDFKNDSSCSVHVTGGVIRKIVNLSDMRILTFEEALKSPAFAIERPMFIMSNPSFPKKLDIFGIRNLTEHMFDSKTTAQEKLPSLLSESEEAFIARNIKPSNYYRRSIGNLNSYFGAFDDEYPLEMWRFSNLSGSRILSEKDLRSTYSFVKKKFKIIAKNTKVAIFERKIYDN